MSSIELGETCADIMSYAASTMAPILKNPLVTTLIIVFITILVFSISNITLKSVTVVSVLTVGVVFLHDYSVIEVHKNAERDGRKNISFYKENAGGTRVRAVKQRCQSYTWGIGDSHGIISFSKRLGSIRDVREISTFLYR